MIILIGYCYVVHVSEETEILSALPSPDVPALSRFGESKHLPDSPPLLCLVCKKSRADRFHRNLHT